MNTYTTVPSGEQVVQELPWRWKVQGRIFLIGGLGFMFDAWDVTLNGILIPLLSKHWSLSPGDCRLDRHGKPDRHGPGRLRLGHHRGHDRAQEGLHRDPADLLHLHRARRVLPRFSVVRRVPFPGRVRPGRLHPGGLCAGGRVHSPQTARPGAHRDGWLVADRRRPLRFRLSRAGRGLRGLAADHAGHGAPGAARVLDPPQRAGIPAVPDPQGPPRRGRQGDRWPGRSHRRRAPGLQPARTAGRAPALRGQRVDAAARALAVQLEDHDGGVGPLLLPSCWSTTCR